MDKTQHNIPVQEKPKPKTRSQSGMQALVRLVKLIPFNSLIRVKDPIFDECNLVATLIEEKYCQFLTTANNNGILIVHNDLPNSSANNSYASCFVLYDKPQLSPIEFTKALCARFDYARVECFGNGIMLGICENMTTAVRRLPLDYMKPKQEEGINKNVSNLETSIS